MTQVSLGYTRRRQRTFYGLKGRRLRLSEETLMRRILVPVWYSELRKLKHGSPRAFVSVSLSVFDSGRANSQGRIKILPVTFNEAEINQFGRDDHLKEGAHPCLPDTPILFFQWLCRSTTYIRIWVYTRTYWQTHAHTLLQIRTLITVFNKFSLHIQTLTYDLRVHKIHPSK